MANPAISRWSDAVTSFEEPRQMFLVGEATGERDVDDRRVGFAQKALRAFDPETHKILVRCHTGLRTKLARKVARAKARGARRSPQDR